MASLTKPQKEALTALSRQQVTPWSEYERLAPAATQRSLLKKGLVRQNSDGVSLAEDAPDVQRWIARELVPAIHQQIQRALPQAVTSLLEQGRHYDDLPVYGAILRGLQDSGDYQDPFYYFGSSLGATVYTDALKEAGLIQGEHHTRAELTDLGQQLQRYIAPRLDAIRSGRWYFHAEDYRSAFWSACLDLGIEQARLTAHQARLFRAHAPGYAPVNAEEELPESDLDKEIDASPSPG